MTPQERGPRSELARYAFGYTDQRPGMSYWSIIIGMLAFILWRIFA